MAGRRACPGGRVHRRDRVGAGPVKQSVRHLTGDAGSAIVDFALVGGLLTVLFVAVLQVMLAQHVRNTLVDCAAEGARYAAVGGRSPAEGVERTRQLITQSLSDTYAQDVTAVRTTRDGLDVIEVAVSAPLPVVGLIGPGGRLDVLGHALVEEP